MSLPKTYVAGFHNEQLVKQMRYNRLGKTELEVSELSIGGGGLSVFYGAFDEAEAIETIQNAIRSGINYIDTAYWYGQGRSEKILGKALKDVPREAYYIATKIGRYELDPANMFDFSAEKTRSSLDNSLKLLGLDYVDIIQIHDIEFAPSMDEVVVKVIPVLEDAVASGKARFVGVTGYPLNVLKQMIEMKPNLFSMVLTYARNTLIDDSLTEYIQFFVDQDIGIVCAAGPSMGLLTNNGPQSWHPADAAVKEVCKEAGEYCAAQLVELGKLAMFHTMLLKGPSTHLVGMNTKHNLQINLDVLFNGLTDHEKTVLGELQNNYFSKITIKHWEGVELKKYRTEISTKTSSS